MENKKFKLNIEGSEYRHLPAKKLQLIAQRDDGEYVISTFEDLIHVNSKMMGKRNPDKKVLFEIRNKMNEKIQFCHYKGNDFINIFVNGGVHSTRFVLNKEGIDSLQNSLANTCIDNKNKNEVKDDGKEHH